MPHRKVVIGAIASGLLLGLSATGIWLMNTWRSAQQSQLESAYVALLPQPTPAVTQRHYEMRGAFTDTVERFRFEGGDQTLVLAIVQRYDLQPAQTPLESKFSAPDWWQLPTTAEYYVRGAGHEYMLLVFDPTTGQVFVEQTQD